MANNEVWFTYYPTEIMIANILNKSIPSKKNMKILLWIVELHLNQVKLKMKT